jgi:hypothetical protein
MRCVMLSSSCDCHAMRCRRAYSHASLVYWHARHLTLLARTLFDTTECLQTRQPHDRLARPFNTTGIIGDMHAPLTRPASSATCTPFNTACMHAPLTRLMRCSASYTILIMLSSCDFFSEAHRHAIIVRCDILRMSTNTPVARPDRTPL